MMGNHLHQRLGVWLGEPTREQLVWLYDHLAKRRHQILMDANLWSDQELSSHVQNLALMTNDVSIEFDELEFVKIRGAWTTYKRRSGATGKKDYVFNMDISIQEKLEKLSKKEGCKINQLIEKLVNQKFDRMEKAPRKPRIKKFATV